MDTTNAQAEAYLQAMAKQLQAERAAAGLTYKEVADKAGMTDQSVMRYMLGKRDIKITHLAAMADALGLDVVELTRRSVERL